MAFTPRTVVNGRLLRSNLNKNISILVNIESSDASCRNLKGKSTDNVDLTIRSDEPVSSKGWVEVIGVPTGPNDVIAKEVIYNNINRQMFLLNCFPFLCRLSCSSRNRMMKCLTQIRTIWLSTSCKTGQIYLNLVERSI